VVAHREWRLSGRFWRVPRSSSALCRVAAALPTSPALREECFGSPALPNCGESRSITPLARIGVQSRQAGVAHPARRFVLEATSHEGSLTVARLGFEIWFSTALA
jgi:hypothetical protein